MDVEPEPDFEVLKVAPEQELELAYQVYKAPELEPEPA